jgi:hypothetical protein
MIHKRGHRTGLAEHDEMCVRWSHTLRQSQKINNRSTTTKSTISAVTRENGHTKHGHEQYIGLQEKHASELEGNQPNLGCCLVDELMGIHLAKLGRHVGGLVSLWTPLGNDTGRHCARDGLSEPSQTSLSVNRGVCVSVILRSNAKVKQ